MIRITGNVEKLCPRCQTPITKETPVKVCSQCHTPQHAECWDFLDACSVYGCGSRQAEPAGHAEETKSCPYCGETIKAVAIRCKHCHADLTTPPRQTQPEEGPKWSDFGRGPLISSAFSYGWKRFSEHIGLLIGSHVFVALMGALMNSLAEPWGRSHMHNYRSPWGLTLAILATLVSTWLGIGAIKINLAIIDGRPAEFRDLFSGGDRLATFLGASLLVGLLVGLGTLLFVIPGIILAVYLIFVPFLAVEQKGVGESISGSMKLVRGSFWPIVGFGLLALFLNVLGSLFFTIGLLITAPITSLALTYIYRRLQRDHGMLR